jgi:hypothetical protein
MKVKVLLGWSVLEDGLSKDAILRNPSAEIAPAAFTKSISGGYWEGVINKTGFVEFEWTSNEFSNVWTVAPTPEVEKA